MEGASRAEGGGGVVARDVDDGEMALTAHRPQIHHSDQGVQYADTRYVALLDGVEISMPATGTPTENGYTERLMRTIKEEEVALSDYADLADARAQIGRFLGDVYLHKRIHSALGYLTPAEFEQDWHARQKNRLPHFEDEKSIQS